MKAVFALVALAASALATGGHDGDTWATVTTKVITTYTTICPVTSTYYEGGKTYYTTYTTTSTVTEVKPTGTR
jgi:hypothetical protein